MLGQHWYFGLIRKYVATFGTLFNDITIRRYDEDDEISHVIKVPLAYSQKDKLMVRLTQDPDLDKEAAIILPRMGFEMGSPYYDGDRKLKSVGKSAFATDNANKFNRLFNPVPYNIPFHLYVYVKNTEDGTKIIEQILPMFKPEFTVTINILPEVGLQMDIPIELRNTVFTELNEGAFKDRRVIMWQLDFELKGYFYGPIQEKPIIKFVNTTFYAAMNYTDDIDVSNTDLSVFSITIQPGLDANGNPTTNSALSIPVNEIRVDDDYGFVQINEEL